MIAPPPLYHVENSLGGISLSGQWCLKPSRPSKLHIFSTKKRTFLHFWFLWCFLPKSNQATLWEWWRCNIAIEDAFCFWSPSLADAVWLLKGISQHQWWSEFGSRIVLCLGGHPFGSSNPVLIQFFWVCHFFLPHHPQDLLKTQNYHFTVSSFSSDGTLCHFAFDFDRRITH